MNEPPGGCGVLRVGVLFVLSPLAFVCRVLSKDLEERADSLPRRVNITHAAPRGIDPVPSGMRGCLASQNPSVACLRAAPRRVHCFISTSSSRTWWEGGRFWIRGGVRHFVFIIHITVIQKFLVLPSVFRTKPPLKSFYRHREL